MVMLYQWDEIALKLQFHFGSIFGSRKESVQMHGVGAKNNNGNINNNYNYSC